MTKTFKSIFLWGFAALLFAFFSGFDSFAASAVDVSAYSGYKPGPGDYVDDNGNIVSLSGEVLVDSSGNVIKADSVNGSSSGSTVIAGSVPAAPSTPNYTVSEEDGGTVYTFEGKKYKAGSSYGVHKISGYSASETGSAMTSSGNAARSRHTVAAASDLPLGTVIIVKGTAGPYPDDYDGIYVVEDRGGAQIEEEKWIDIYFDTYEEAVRTTAAGWNYAEAWIAEAVQ